MHIPKIKKHKIMKKLTLLIAMAAMALMFSCAPSKTVVDTS